MTLLTKSANTSKAGLLGGVGLFAGLNQREIARITALVDEFKADAGHVLCREGKSGQEFFVIVEGQAEATLRGEHLAFLGPGAFFGEMSLLDRGPRSATVTATTPMHLLAIFNLQSVAEMNPGFWPLIYSEDGYGNRPFKYAIMNGSNAMCHFMLGMDQVLGVRALARGGGT